jgi:serine/threonine protein kinase
MSLLDEDEGDKEKVQVQLRRRSASDPTDVVQQSQRSLAQNEGAPLASRGGGNPADYEGSGVEWRDLHNLQFYRESPVSLIFSAELAGRSIMCKLLKSDAAFTDPRAPELFQTELSLYAMHKCPHIVTLVALGGNGKFAVLERLQETLHDRLTTLKSFNVFDIVPTFLKSSRSTKQEWRDMLMRRLKSCLELARAVKYAHLSLKPEACVIHRDINPSNVGFRADGSCVLFDFNNVAILPFYRADYDNEVPREMTGGVGSARYQSPEVALHNPYGANSDVWSWAVCAWEMLTLEVPYGDIGVGEFLARVVEGGERLDCGRKDWPQEIQDMLASCFKEQLERPKMVDIVEVLERYVD